MPTVRILYYVIFMFSHDGPFVQGIARWLPASPAEAEALPHEGASAPVMLIVHSYTVLEHL